MNTLCAGFARVDITPMSGIGVAGYYKPRYVKGVLDALELNALALQCGQTRLVLLSLDHCGVHTPEAAAIRAAVAKVCDLPVEAVYLHATHTHTAPFLVVNSDDRLERAYFDFVLHRAADAAHYALDDLRPARMGYAVGSAPNIAFVRRFRMKDGSIQTNPGVNNPDIVEPIGEVDERVNVLRFDREGADSLVLVNFGNHPDTVGGELVSADWPGFLRRRLEKALGNVRCIFFNGAQGDVNHVNVHPTAGDFNDLTRDFDDVSRGYGHARHMGNVVAGAVLQVFDKVTYTDVDSLKFLQRTIQIPSNMPNPEDLPEARRIEALHQAGRDCDLPYEGMMLTTVVAEAERMLKLADGPEYFNMELSGLAVGPAAFIGIPGEPFTGIGRALKEAPSWTLVLPTCLTGGDDGYFPMREAYDEGGYEARSSPFRAGVAERIIDEGLSLLAELRK